MGIRARQRRLRRGSGAPCGGVGVSAPDLGFDVDLGHLWLPVGVLAVFALGAFALASSRHAHLIADARVEGMRGGRLAFYTLVRIPIGTAAVEETIFRGVMSALWRDAGLSDVGAAAVASAAFGLWHISPTIIGVRMNDEAASRKKLAWAVVGAVVATTVAGLALTWLREWSGSLLGPILVHAGVNSVGALAAVRAGRMDGAGGA